MTVGGEAVEAAIASILLANVQNQPLDEVLEELAAVLIELGGAGIDDAVDAAHIQSNLLTALTNVVHDLAALEQLPGVSVEAATTLMASKILAAVDTAPNSNELSGALVAAVSSNAVDDPQGRGAMQLNAFMAAGELPGADPAFAVSLQRMTLGALGSAGTGDFGSDEDRAIAIVLGLVPPLAVDEMAIAPAAGPAVTVSPNLATLVVGAAVGDGGTQSIIGRGGVASPN